LPRPTAVGLAMTVDAQRDRHPLTFTKVRARDDSGSFLISNFCLEYWSLEFDWSLVIGAWDFIINYFNYFFILRKVLEKFKGLLRNY